MRLPSVPPLELAQEPHPNLLLLPFAASFFCNIRHIKRIWRKRVGVEPTIRPAKDRIAGFEGRGDHRTPFASGGSIAGDEKQVQRPSDCAAGVDPLAQAETCATRSGGSGFYRCPLGANQGGDEVVEGGAGADLVVRMRREIG